jgi:hypothetical protein
MDDKKFEEVVKKSFSRSDVCRAYDLPINGAKLSWVTKNINRLNLDIDHFSVNGSHKTQKYERVEKTCPSCGKKFVTKSGHKKEKSTCSHSCGNKHFRKSKKLSSYRSLCFAYHGKKCAICSESKIVEVHHYDGDNKNNSPENLIPVCPTHHQYIHSQYKAEVIGGIEEYKKWRKPNHLP